MKDMVEELNRRNRRNRNTELEKESAYVTILRMKEEKEYSKTKYRISFSIDFSKETLMIKEDSDGSKFCKISTRSEYLIIKKIKKITEIAKSWEDERIGQIHHFKYNKSYVTSEIEIEFDDIEVINKKDEYFIWKN